MDKEQQAIERLRLAAEMSEAYHDGAPLIVTTSGGKDSDVCLRLAEAAGNLPGRKVRQGLGAAV